MQYLSHRNHHLQTICSRRSRIFFLVLLSVLLLGTVYYINSDAFNAQSQIDKARANGRVSRFRKKVNARDDCLYPNTYVPPSPGSCVLTASGAVQVTAGASASIWNPGECEATVSRFAPWLQSQRHELAAAPALHCHTRSHADKMNVPLFIMEKTGTSYRVTEPLWASLSVTDETQQEQQQQEQQPHGAATDFENADASMSLENDVYEEEIYNDKPDGCPDLYLTSHTLRFGDTFNQIQSIISGIWFSKVFNRTYVLPLLGEPSDGAVNKADTTGNRRTTLERYFDFDGLREAGYCIVRYSTFAADMQRRCPKAGDCGLVYYEKTGQSYYKRLFQKRLVNVAPLLAPPDMSKKALKFSFRYGNLSSVLPLDGAPRATFPPEPLVMIENLIAFFFRPPFKDYIHILGLLHPSAAMATKVREVLRPHQSRHTIAFHLRYREGGCEREQNFFHRYVWPPTAASPLPFDRHDAGKRSIVEECAYTAEDVVHKIDFAMGHLLPRASPSNVTLLLASDNQRKVEMKRLQNTLVDDGYHLYVSGKLKEPNWYQTRLEKKVFGVVFDYFLLVSADVFFGNRMSSISQSACLARLGRGKECHGVPAGHFRSLFYSDPDHRNF